MKKSRCKNSCHFKSENYFEDLFSNLDLEDKAICLEQELRFEKSLILSAKEEVIAHLLEEFKVIDSLEIALSNNTLIRNKDGTISYNFLMPDEIVKHYEDEFKSNDFNQNFSSLINKLFVQYTRTY